MYVRTGIRPYVICISVYVCAIVKKSGLNLDRWSLESVLMKLMVIIEKHPLELKRF